MERANWSYAGAGRQLFGPGASSHVGTVTASLGTRAFLCTDEVLVRAGMVEAVIGSLRRAGVEVTVFDGGSPEMDRPAVERCAELARAARPDVIVGLGGGSNLDLAKLTALLVSHPAPLTDYYGEGKVPGPVLPVVAIPTTAGTGSEVTPVAVLSDPDSALKVGVSSHHLTPPWALLDPVLTHSCPPTVTAHSGLDALAHAIEAFTARTGQAADGVLDPERVFIGKNPVSDALAVQAIPLIGRNLVTVCRDGADELAREEMMLGSMLAGMAFGVAGTTLAHALQYPIGARTKTPHGMGVALLLPAVLRFNRAVREPELAAVGRLLGAEAGASQSDAASAAIASVERICRDANLPAGLSAIGVTASELPEIAAAALTIQRLVRNNARAVDQDGLLEILHDALTWRSNA